MNVNIRLNKQNSDKQMTMIHSFYTVYTVANGANNNTRLRTPANNEMSLVLCILTSKQVLHTLVAHRNHFFLKIKWTSFVGSHLF